MTMEINIIEKTQKGNRRKGRQIIHLYLSRFLDGVERTTHHKNRIYSSIKCNSQSQQSNLSNFQKKGIVSIRFKRSMGNDYFYVIRRILKILNILLSTIYLMFYPLMLEKSLIMKVMNMLRKEGTSQIIIYLIHCMLTFHNIETKT